MIECIGKVEVVYQNHIKYVRVLLEALQYYAARDGDHYLGIPNNWLNSVVNISCRTVVDKVGLQFVLLFDWEQCCVDSYWGISYVIVDVLFGKWYSIRYFNSLILDKLQLNNIFAWKSKKLLDIYWQPGESWLSQGTK